ncbi:MAG: homoserine dehydrogenase [Flavobacteriales bacterium]|nr:homoserine dehydrogenase [Flavobacteriales bacterium]
MSKLKIGLFGFGCVGSGLYKVLNESKQLDAEIVSIVAKNKHKPREKTKIPISFEPEAILDNELINVVVELINNSEEAYLIIKKAIQSKKHIVTANKKLLSEHLDELIALAKENGVSLLYEASVAGSIPIIRNLEEYYNNDTLTSIEGIVNGTSNYILSQSNKGISYTNALKDAQEKGFAEVDPKFDVEGFDSVFKLTILIKHAFGLSIASNQLLTVGIKNLKEQDVRFVKEKKFRVKLFAKAFKVENHLFAFVAPHLVDATHAAFDVGNEFNAIIVQAAYADKQLFYGKGAGSLPTASAVLSDISALNYNYAYEYRKTANAEVKLSDDLKLKVYIGSTNFSSLSEFQFEEIEDLYIGIDYAYQIGTISLTELLKVNWNERIELSLLLFSEQKINKQMKPIQNSNFNFLKKDNSYYSIH